MASDETWTSASGGAMSADTGAMISRPKMGVVDLILQLWRAKWLMMLVFIPIFALGLAAAFMMPKTYEASSRLLVSLGDEQVFSPKVGDLAAGAIPEQEQLIQAELELLQSPVVAERVLMRIPLDAIYPDLLEEREAILAKLPSRDPAAADYAMRQIGIEAIQKNFGVGAAPKTPVIRTTFKHEDPEVAATVLNALILSYQEYRTAVYTTRRPDTFSRQRKGFEENLLDAEDDIRTFLIGNQIGDFESERLASQTLFASVTDELFKVESLISSVEGQLSTLRRQMASTEPLVDIFVEDSTDQQLLNLQLEREEALTKYKPDSRTVKAIDARIKQVTAYLDTQTGPVGTTRRGPNPVFQDMETRLSNLETDAQSLTNQRAELQRQKTQIEARQRRIADLEPQWQELQRKRDLIEANLSSASTREIEARSLNDMAALGADNIKVLEEARPPVEGSSLKLPVAALALLFAGFTALMVGLLRAMTREGFSTARSVERTTGLPVIASVAKRR